MAKRKMKRSCDASASRRGPMMAGWWRKLSPEGRRRAMRVMLHLALVGLLVGGALYGLRAAGRHVQRMDRYRGEIEVVVRTRHAVGDAVVAVRAIEQARIVPGERMTVRGVDQPAGRLLVEHAGQSLSVSADDVQAEWLAGFAHVPQECLRRAQSAVQSVQAAGQASGSVAWLDDELAGQVARQVARYPYVAAVVQVDKQLTAGGSGQAEGGFQRRVIVDVEYRRPLAVIWHGEPNVAWHAYVLDAKGAVLERRDPPLGPVAELPQITHFRLGGWAGSLEPGSKLEAADVRAGLDLLALLSDRPYYRQISEVDVRNHGRRDPRLAELVLLAREAGLPPQPIEWGVRLDSPDYLIEFNDAAAKLLILNNIWRDYNTLNLQRLHRGPYDLFRRKDMAFWPRADAATGAAFAAPRN